MKGHHLREASLWRHAEQDGIIMPPHIIIAENLAVILVTLFIYLFT